MSEIHFKLSQSVKGEIHVTNSLWGWEWNWVEGPNTIWTVFFFMCVFSLCVNWILSAWFSHRRGYPATGKLQTLPYSFCPWRKRVFSERGFDWSTCITFHYLTKTLWYTWLWHHRKLGSRDGGEQCWGERIKSSSDTLKKSFKHRPESLSTSRISNMRAMKEGRLRAHTMWFIGWESGEP